MPTPCDEIQNLMNRIKGQMNGVDKMISDGRDPMEIIQQVSAVRSALSRLATELLKDESKKCLKNKSDSAKLKKFDELVTNLFKIT